MKKRLMAAALAAAVIMTTGSVFASPIELDGNMSYRYRAETNAWPGRGNHDASIFKFTLNAKNNIAPNLDLYARLAFEDLTNTYIPGAPDFTTPGNHAIGNIDQFGLNYKNAGFNYKAGRQSVTIGGTALLYNQNYLVGKHSQLDGITISGKSGVTSISAVAAREDYIWSSTDRDSVYALHGSYSPAKDWTVGATLAKYDSEENTAGAPTTNHVAVDASYTSGKATYFGEYVKSNYYKQNKGYDIGTSYAFNAKDSAYVIYYNIQNYSTMGRDMTDFDGDAKGFYYGYDHKFNKSTTGSLFYRQRAGLSTDKWDNSSFRATVSYKF